MIEIRNERKEDFFEVEKVIRESFFNVYMEGAEEHLLVHKLRDDENYIKSLSKIALLNNEIVGAIFYSKAKLIDENNNEHKIITFGPLGVLPKVQKEGIGKILLEQTIKEAKKEDYDAIVITGVPTYYPRFGFKSCFELGLSMPDGEQFPALLGLELKEGYFKKIGKTKFVEPDVYEVRASKKELDEFDKDFPFLKKEKRPGQWKPANE